MQRRALPATVQIEQCRRLLRSLREGVKRGQACRGALERADVKRDGAGHDPIGLPLPHQLGIERVFAGIEVGKQLRDRGGGLRLGGGNGERQQAGDEDRGLQPCAGSRRSSSLQRTAQVCACVCSTTGTARAYGQLNALALRSTL